MNSQCIFSEYIDGALEGAVFDKLEDGSFWGSIPICPVVVACSNSLRACERELRSVLEDWLLLGLKLNHILPVIRGIDLNKDMTHAELEPV
ncbi:MAG: type II toxin-antitoxin system HicB family antitoxin [Isosphaeraceae bacterium]